MPANNVYELKLTWSTWENFYQNILHYEQAPGAFDANLVAAAIIDGWESAVWPTWQPQVITKTVLQSARCRRVNNGGSLTQLVVYPSLSHSGTATGTGGHTGEAIVAEFPYLSDPSPKYPDGHQVMGKLYITGMADAAIADGHPTSAGRASVQSIIDKLLLPLTIVTGGTATFGTWSRKFKKFHAATENNISAKVGIQKRRLLPIL